MISNPSEFREQLQSVLDSSPLMIGGSEIDRAVINEAIEEVIASIVRSYMGEDGPTACEKIVGATLLALIEGKQ